MDGKSTQSSKQDILVDLPIPPGNGKILIDCVDCRTLCSSKT